MDRRGFVQLAVGVCVVGTLPGCASAAVTRVVPAAGVVRLPIRNFPQLDRPGGYLRVQPEGVPSPLLVLALEDRRYAAVSPVCTHLGCTVNLEGDRLVCPCHGSTYDRSGRVLRGPAERPLQRFPTVLSDGELVIQLEATG